MASGERHMPTLTIASYTIKQSRWEARVGEEINALVAHSRSSDQ